jgi:hypothetical protein
MSKSATRQSGGEMQDESWLERVWRRPQVVTGGILAGIVM